MKGFAPGLILIMIILTSCFKEDEMVNPHEKGDEITFEFDSSMYDYQIFFDLDSANITSIKKNNAWTVAFESADTGWKVNVNSSAYYGVYPTGETNFNEVVTSTDPGKYFFDASSGHPDSTSFNKWLNRTTIPYTPTGEIFVIGKYNGISYDPEWLVKFISYSDSAYTFQFSAPAGIPAERQVIKNPAYNKIYYNLNNGGSEVIIEPAKNSWDLLFANYGTILFTDEGVPTPYFVRGVLMNSNVSVAIDSLASFSEIDFQYAGTLIFDNQTDAIGHEWKDVEIDFNSGTAVYITRSDLTYIVKDTRGYIYKLRFIDFYNKSGKEGYPTFELQKL